MHYERSLIASHEFTMDFEEDEAKYYIESILKGRHLPRVPTLKGATRRILSILLRK